LKKERENEKQITQKSPNLDLSDIEEDENLINFMENLDYDKYVKNQEIREALFLLKNKVDKEKVENPEENGKENLEEENKDNNFAEKIEETLVNLPPIDSKVGQLHDKDWDGKNLNEDSEFLKKKMADKILKLDKVDSLILFLFLFFLEIKNCAFCSVY